jgi:hypothetical protein
LPIDESPDAAIVGELGPDGCDLTRQAVKSRRVKSRRVKSRRLSGDERTRTADPLLAKQVLYQLSYVPG